MWVSFPVRVCLGHNASLPRLEFSFGDTCLMSQPQEVLHTFPEVPFYQVQLRLTDRQGCVSVALAGAQVWVPPFSTAGSPVASSWPSLLLGSRDWLSQPPPTTSFGSLGLSFPLRQCFLPAGDLDILWVKFRLGGPE